MINFDQFLYYLVMLLSVKVLFEAYLFRRENDEGLIEALVFPLIVTTFATIAYFGIASFQQEFAVKNQQLSDLLGLNNYFKFAFTQLGLFWFLNIVIGKISNIFAGTPTSLFKLIKIFTCSSALMLILVNGAGVAAGV